MPISATDLNKAYLAYFGRPADATGRAYFATLEQADVIKAFDASAESKAIYGEDTASKINAIYKNLFNREAEPAGLTYWLGQISSGKVTPAGAAFAILNGALGTDKTAVENKLAASDAFIKAMDTTAEIVGYSGLNAAASARAFLATVSDSAASLTAAVAGAQAAVTAAINAGTNEAGASTVLKTTQDILVGTAGNDVYRAVAGKADGAQDQTTLNSSDIIDGAAGNDTMIVNLTGNLYQGGARLKNIETLQLGTNVTNAPAVFDYNVNQGTNEITEVTTIVADQINGGEVLTVQNIVRTDAAGAKIAPTLSWVNDSNTQAAGVVNYTYRAAELTGTADEQKISLKSVNNGDINLSAGFETISITSVGTEQVTMQPGADNTVADVTSGSSLRTVNLAGTAEIGKNAGVLASGLTDRVVGADGSGVATQSNLLSVAEVVTKVDANTAQAAVNVRFVNTDATGTNVTFLGGAGNDYVEFELGNISATGGAGDDTFAFINTGANSTFGEGDSIDGGAGSDTIQIGLNGSNVAGNYNISETELRNKSSVGVIDLRGFNTTLTLSSDFVSKADTADSITVRTDKVVQTSLTNSANGTATTPLTSFATEDAVTNTVNLTKLSSNQSVNFVGGSGSDRIILNDATFNVLKTINGGNYTEGTTGSNFVAGSNRYDTITVVTNGENVVIDAQDLSNVSDVEGFVLTKNSAAATYNITLTRAFMNANTEAINNATNTGINDTVFQIGTSNAANNSALNSADTVTIDVRDLLNSTDAAAATGFTRLLDVTALENAGLGANLRFIGNTGNLTLAQVRAAGIVIANGADANFADVVVNSAAFPGAAPLFFQGTAADESVTLVAPSNSVNMGGGTDTINIGALAATGTLDGGAGTDTIVFGAGGSIAGATVQNVEAFTMAGAGFMMVAQHNAFISGANAGGAADTLTFTTAGTVTAADADIETYNLAAGTNQITLAGATTQAINGNTGDDTVVATGADTARKTIALGTGSDTLTISSAFAADWSLAAAGAAGANVTGVETVNLQGGLATGVNALTMFNGAATVNLTSVTGQANGEIILGTGGQTVNVSGTGTGTYVVAANAGADAVSITGSAGRVVINQGSNTTVAGSSVGVASLVTAFDTITGFRAGVDKIDAVAAGAGALTLQAVAASTSAADLAGALGTAVAAAVTAAAANFDTAGDTVIVNIASGTAAGTYLVANQGATNGAFTAAEDLVIKMVGTVGTLTLADIV